LAAPAKPARITRVNLLSPAKQGATHAELPLPAGVRRRPAMDLPPSLKFEEKKLDTDALRAEELARMGKMTSLTDILRALSDPTNYRTYSMAISKLADAIRKLSAGKQFSVPQRFGCATADELALQLLMVFRKKGLDRKAIEVAAARKAGSFSKPQGKIWTYGGTLVEEMVRMDEALTRILRGLAADELAKMKSAQRPVSLKVGRGGRYVQTEVAFSPKAEVSPVLRSVEVATKLKGNEKLLDSVDDLHAVVVKDGGKNYLVVLVRAQIKREGAAAKLGPQIDKDLERWTRPDLEALVLKDQVDANNAPLRFAPDEILFVPNAVSRPVGIVQNSQLAGARTLRQDTLLTPKNVGVNRLSVGVDVELHEKLLELVLTSGALPR